MLIYFTRFCILTILYIISFSAHASDDDKIDKILLFGDSITAGYGLPESFALPNLVEQNLKKEGYDIEVINGGVSGDTTSGGKNRLGWTLDKYEPDLVVIALGGNDMLRGVPPQTVRENVDEMLKIAMDKDVKIVLSEAQASINLGMRYKNEFNSLFEDLADDYDVLLYPFYLEKTFNQPGLMQGDGIHPSAKGAKLIADDLSEYLIDEFLDTGFF
jgi:acyl-CoA thioesterase-1